MEIKLVNYTADFLELSSRWLNDPEMKKLTNAPVFSIKDQLDWFNTLSERKDYFIRGIQCLDVKIGACGLKNITATDAEYWGYIGEKDYWGMGIGSRILTEMENEASKFGVNSVWLNVLTTNTKAIRLYSKNGYFIESENADIQKMRKKI